MPKPAATPITSISSSISDPPSLPSPSESPDSEVVLSERQKYLITPHGMYVFLDVLCRDAALAISLILDKDEVRARIERLQEAEGRLS